MWRIPSDPLHVFPILTFFHCHLSKLEHVVQSVLITVDLVWVSQVSPLISLFLPGSSPDPHIAFSSHLPLIFYILTIPLLFLWHFWRARFCRKPNLLVCLIFSHGELMVCICGVDITVVMFPSAQGSVLEIGNVDIDDQTVIHIIYPK